MEENYAFAAMMLKLMDTLWFGLNKSRRLEFASHRYSLSQTCPYAKPGRTVSLIGGVSEYFLGE